MGAKALNRKGTALAKCSAERAKKDSDQQQQQHPSIGGNEFVKHPDDDTVNRDLPFSLQAKLRELLYNIINPEVKLSSAAAKEFVKLLKGETGGDLLRLYIDNSPNLAELQEAWEIRKKQQGGVSYIFKLIHTILSHPEGKGRSTAIDRFAWFFVKKKLGDVQKVLKSNAGKQALLLLASIVRRGHGIAWQVAQTFQFEVLAKVGEKLVKDSSTRKAFVAFSLSFLEVGKPRLLRSVLRHKYMYAKVLQEIGNDSEDTVASVLSTLKDKILVKESLVPPRLRSVLFGTVTLAHLVSFSAREDGGIVNELAHEVLLEVCTDPSNGLMPDANRNLSGNPDRLLTLMRTLRATEIVYHRDLLLAIVRSRPSFASAFFENFPYNVEDFASPSWFSSISLAADLVSSVGTSRSFDPPSTDSDFQTIMKCILPRPFSRSLFTKGMLHSDFLVKHGTLRFLLDTLRLLDSFLTSWKLCSSHSCSAEQVQAEKDVMGEVRSFFPDCQVLLTVLKSLDGSGGTPKMSLKRKAAVLDSELVASKKRLKKPEKKEACDIVIGGVTCDDDMFLMENPLDAQMTDQVDAEKECLGIVSEIWGSEFCSKHVVSVDEAEMFFHIKLLEVLRIYVRSVPSGLEGSFDFFMKLLSSSLTLPAEFQRALLSLLNECISGTQTERVPTKTPPLMFKHLHVLVNLLLFSSIDEVKDLAYDLALEAMRSTGAFAKSPSEIGAWFQFLPGFDKIKRPLKVQVAVQSMSSAVISFLCEAVSTVGNNLFKQWDIVRSSLSHFKGASIGFSPLTVCILQKCVRLLNSESKTFSLPEKSEISLYICCTLKYLLQNQVDSRSLSYLVQSVLCEVVEGSKDSLGEWRPLRMLLLFSQSLLDNKPFILHSRSTIGVVAADTSFANTLDEIKEKVKSISPDQDEYSGIVKTFSSALKCETTESILKNFASVMAVSCDLYGTSSSLLQSISFLDENFLGNLLKLSPDLFVRGEIGFSDCSSKESQEIKSKSAFFLEQMSFPALLDAVMRMDVSCLLEFPRLSELLLLKVSQPDIQLILNWLSQIRSFYNAQPAPGLCQRSEICLRLMKHLLSQTSEQNLTFGPSSDKLLDPFAKRKHQVAQIIIRHPVMMALLESPLDCGTSSPREQNVIGEIDQRILDLLVYTCEHLLFDEKHIVLKGDVREKKSVMAIKDLVQRLLLVFRGKFELCVGSQSYAPLLQPSHLIHALLRFISPLKLLYLSRSMLSKTNEEDLASSKSSMILSLGLDIAGGAFEMLMLYSHQPAGKRRVYDLLWELEENNYESSKLIEEVYSLGCKFSTSMGLVSADTCLLKVMGGLYKGKHSVHPLTMTVSEIVGRTPKDLIIHCVSQANMTRAKILFYLVESSPLHLSVFGHIFCSLLSKQQDDFKLTDDQFIMLLPAALSYLKLVITKFEKRCVDIITSAYSSILINGFLQWSKFLSGCIFEDKPHDLTWDMDTMFNASLLGKAVCMFQYHFGLTESPTKTDDLLKILCSMFPHTSSADMLNCEIQEVVDVVESVDDLYNVAIRVVAKIELARICLKEISPSNRERLLLLNYLVSCWLCVVKRCDGSIKGKEDKRWVLCKSLEDFVLRSVLKVSEDMCEKLVHLDSLTFFERLMKSVLLYRFEDTKTLKTLREIFSLLSRGKYSYAPHLQLLISHSQFTPTISSISHTGDLFTPVSSILKHVIIPSPSSVRVKSCCVEAPDYEKQLEIVKTLRVLLSNCGKVSGINLKELHFLLLCSYGATMSEIDLELNKLMQLLIELIADEEDENGLNVSETDYLWGKAALKIREGMRCTHDDASEGGEADYLQSLVKENLCVDPKTCALTVLYFPYQHTAKKCSLQYDPAFILRFSEHSLKMGYIEPVEFASLGLLAVAFVSISSADLDMRKLGYKTLGRFVDVLKGCEMNMHEKNRLMLLLLFVQNGVNKQWQRISTVSAVFAAETSLILLDSSHEHYGPILDFLKRSETLSLRGIPLFRDFFLSSAVQSQRLWALRLLCVGLKSEDDAQIYIDNSILEKLISFFSSPFADYETKGLILQVVRESVKFGMMAEHLAENCDLLSWCSSCIPMFTTKPISGDEDSRFVLVLEVIADALASRKVADTALEELMEISSRLCRVLGGGLVSVQDNGTCVDLILQILSATLKISQNRERVRPHFTITYEVIFQLFEAVLGNCDSPRVEGSAERGLDTILRTTPPVDIIHMEVEKLRRFLMWGTSTALKSDLKKGSIKPSESHRATEKGQEESMVAKFLRWLLASVILGKLYSEANHSDTKPETFPTLLFEFLKKGNLRGSMTKSEHVIGEVIVHLQKLVCTNYNMVLLPSVVFALSLMLLGNGLGTTAGTESESDDYKLIKSLRSRISNPPEANPDWRWSYYPSLEPAIDVEKMNVLQACQHLLMIFSDMLGETPREYHQLRESFDMSSLFEWERGFLETLPPNQSVLLYQ